MTVSEPIIKLQTLQLIALVVNEIYDTIKRVSLIEVEINLEKEWCVGKYIDKKKVDAQQVVF